MQHYKLSIATILALTVLALGVTPASAQVIFDNGLGTDNYGYYAGAGNTGPDTNTSVGDVFTATTSGTVDYVNFSAIYYSSFTPPPGDTFALNLYSASPVSGPETLITADTFTSYTATVIGSHTPGGGSPHNIYQIGGQLDTSFTLTAGTTYYFSISDLNDSSNNFAVVVSNTSPAGSSTAFYGQAPGSSAFVPGEDALSFQLSVPEPSEWALLVMGCLGVVVAQRYTRRSA